VGIGNSVPGAALGVGNTTDQAQLAGGLSGATSVLYLGSPNNGSGGQSTLSYVRSTGITSLGPSTTGGALGNALNIDGSGNVGIGTSSPTALLAVGGNPPGSGVINAVGSSGAIAVAISDNLNSSLYIRPAAGGTIIGTDGGGTIRFATNGNTSSNEAMRIDYSGNVLVGTTTQSGLLTIQNSTSNVLQWIKSTNSSYTGNALWIDNSTASGTGWNFIYGTTSNNSVLAWRVLGNGNIQNVNNSYGATSDSKLKENIVDATPKLDDLLKVKIRNYNFIDDENKLKQIGVVAQEIEQVFPGIVEEVPDRDEEGNLNGEVTKSVKYSVFVPMLVKAIQELKAIVDTQAEQIKALQGAK